MDTRLVKGTIVAICLAGVAACEGSDSSRLPLTPTPPALPPAPTPPPPPPSPAVDLTGDYALRLDVGDGCEQVPKEFRMRRESSTTTRIS
jgi:hypothetical protein